LWISQNVPYPPKTGVLQRNFNLIREASRTGQVTLLAILQKGVLPTPVDLDEARLELGKFCRKIEIVELPIESSRLLFLAVLLKSVFTTDPFSVNWTKSAEMTDAINRLMHETEFDVIHYDTISMAAHHHLAGAIPKALNHHNIESHLIKRRATIEKNPLKRLYYHLEGTKLERFEAKVCPAFDVNFTVSELDKSRLLEIAPNAYADVVANGVDCDYFSPQPDSQVKPQSVIMVSGMNWFPNRDAVLYMCDEIWPALSNAYPDISWTVVGSSPPQRLLDLATRDNRVRVTGFVDDVRPYLAEAQVYLCPMRDGGGTRLKILDALAMGKPIVATTMAYEGISITPNVNVLVADTPSEFVRQIGRLFDDRDLCSTLADAARRFVMEHYSWSVIGDRLGDNYRRLRDKK
jgi:glycosyltransferase involved in cell wall biosynthesis